MNKTNAMRYLDALGVSYEVLEYQVKDGEISGVAVAKKIGYPPENIYKTLVSRGDDIYVVVLASNQEVNLKKLAKHTGSKKVHLVAVKELLGLTGYIRGGCSPFAMKKEYPIYVQEDIILEEYVIVSAGKIGLQIKIPVDDFLKASKAKVVDVAE